jgi:hypothetical protein
MPHDSAAIEMRKLSRDPTCEVPGAVSPRQKIRHGRDLLDVLLDEMLDEMSDVIFGENTDSA